MYARPRRPQSSVRPRALVCLRCRRADAQRLTEIERTEGLVLLGPELVCDACVRELEADTLLDPGLIVQLTGREIEAA